VEELSKIHVRLDVHKDSISVAAAEPGAGTMMSSRDARRRPSKAGPCCSSMAALTPWGRPARIATSPARTRAGRARPSSSRLPTRARTSLSGGGRGCMGRVRRPARTRLRCHCHRRRLGGRRPRARAAADDGPRPGARRAPAWRRCRDVPVDRPHLERRQPGEPQRARPAVVPRDAGRGRSQLCGPARPWRTRGSRPLQGDLSGLPPVLPHVSEDEVLLDNSRRYQQRCEAAGARATEHVWRGMTHVFPSSVSISHAAREALDITGEFLEGALARRS